MVKWSACSPSLLKIREKHENKQKEAGNGPFLNQNGTFWTCCTDMSIYQKFGPICELNFKLLSLLLKPFRLKLLVEVFDLCYQFVAFYLKICLWIHANHFSDEVTVDEDADKLLRAVNHLCLLDANEVTITQSLN